MPEGDQKKQIKTIQFGEHITIDGYEGDYELLNNKEMVSSLLSDLTEKLNMKMLSKYRKGKYKKLELSDKKDIEKFTSKFPPYSDFNFYNMWAWDIHNKMVLSQLNGNLVVLFNDYVNSEEFLAFLGEKRAAETASILIAYSKDKHKKGFLKFVPEEVILAFKNLSFIVKADKDSFDYVYLVEHLAIMKNWHKNTSGKRIRRFLKTGIKYTIKHSSPEDITKDQEKYKEFFKKWAEDKNIKDHYKLYEYKAFERFLTIKDKNIHFVTLFFLERMVGFTVY